MRGEFSWSKIDFYRINRADLENLNFSRAQRNFLQAHTFPMNNPRLLIE